MENNIFEESTLKKLTGVFNNMTTPKKQVEPIQESVSDDIQTKDEPTIEEHTVGSKFNAVFESILGEGCDKCDDIDCNKKKCKKTDVVKEEFDGEELEGGEDEFSDEDEFVKVPKPLLDELYAFLEDSMSSGDDARVDDVEFELEEGANHSLAIDKMKNTQCCGKSVQKDKTGTSVAKTGYCSSNKTPRTGTVSFLKNLLSCYTTKGSTKQKNSLKIKDQAVNK